MDISMPRLGGLEATAILGRELPETAVIIITQNDPGVASAQAIAANARGFVSKTRLAEDLFPQLEKLSKTVAAPIPLSMPDLFSSETKMSALMRAKDWSQTSLGPVESWSPALRMMVRFMLPNPFPQLLWWGPEFCCLYNDAYIPVLGSKHPWALGLPTSTVWGEVWHVLAPLVETPFRGGPATWIEDIPLEVNRNGFVEETHFTIAYSPVPDETAAGGIGGVLATVHEISQKVVGERRVTILRDLGARSAEPKSTEEACMTAAETLERHPKDVPFALLYLIDEKQTHAYFAAGSGVNSNDRRFPRTVPLHETEAQQMWPFAAVMNTEEVQLVSDLPSRFDAVPPGPWSDAPRSAAIVPIRSTVAHQLAGFAVIGISSRLQFDESYRNFLDLVSTQVSISITNARAYAEERKRAEALAEIDRAKTAFFSNVSHEFRTPLTLMLGPLQDLLSRSQTHLTPTAKEQLELVNRNGARLLRLVNTLLDFSRIEAGRVKAVYQATDLAAFTTELAGVFRSATERAGLRLEVDCHATTDVAYVDRDMWEKIVLNLISNAFKFTFDGEIAVGLKQIGHSVELSIRDTGVGIPSDEMPHLFDRFHRVPNTRSRTHEGSGIGLALVYELVKLHGGSMRVESMLGKGTTFFVSIPLGQDHLAENQVGGERSLASTATGANPFVQEALRWLPDVPVAEVEEIPLETELLPIPCPAGPIDASSDHRCVLVADDNADMRQYLTRLLAERYEVVAVADGRAALDAIRKRPPHLVLSDIMMPNLDGFGLLKELRADPATNTIPVILLSARAGEESRVEGIDAGADDYLVKPFSARELLARVQTHLELARVRDQANKLVRENEERLRAFVHASSDVIYRMSPDWNEMRHLEGKDFIADTQTPSHDWVRTYIYPEDQALVNAAIENAIRTKDIFELEHRVLRADGSFGWTFSRAVPLFDEHGEIIEWFGAASDVTARKLAEEALREAQGTLELRVKERTEELERVQVDLRDLSGKLLQLQDEERRRIARELHDSAGQTLTVLAMNLTRLAQLAKAGDSQVGAIASETRDLVQRLTEEIRTTSYLLHPPLLDDSGIAAALRWYVGGLSERSRLKIELNVAEEFGRLPHEMELAIFRIVQECLTNIIRHADSEDARIVLRREGRKVQLEVEDNGKGIPESKLAAINRGGSGVGVRGMKDRVRQLNGEIDVKSGSSGTTISIVFPLAVDVAVYDRTRAEPLAATG
jgi:signal transduction histidine kinase